MISFVARYLVLGLSLAGGSLMAAPEPLAAAQTNEAAAQVLNNLGQADDPAQLQDMALPNELTATNELPQSNSPAASEVRTDRVNRFDNFGRSQNDDRRSRGRRSNRSRANQGSGSTSGNGYSRDSDGSRANGPANTNNGPASLDYASFKIVVDRNIFDPNRYPHSSGALPPSKQRIFDSLTLVGTMSYEKGTFAFFDGTSSEYKKALKLTDSIAGYKVTDIAPNAVKLASATNQVELSVGAQLRREENGPWLLAGQSTSYPTLSSSPPSGSGTTTTGSESDIIKKLMQRREKE